MSETWEQFAKRHCGVVELSDVKLRKDTINVEGKRFSAGDIGIVLDRAGSMILVQIGADKLLLAAADVIRL